MDRYTVIYEGDPTGVKILSGETAPGRAVGIFAGDLGEIYHREDAKAAKDAEAATAALTEARVWVEHSIAALRPLSPAACEPGEALLRKIDAALASLSTPSQTP